MNSTRILVSGEGEALSFATLPLWQWAATKAARDHLPVNRAVRRIAAQGRVSFSHAAVVAELMGITMEASQ
jgi:hypothetical protein